MGLFVARKQQLCLPATRWHLLPRLNDLRLCGAHGRDVAVIVEVTRLLLHACEGLQLLAEAFLLRALGLCLQPPQLDRALAYARLGLHRGLDLPLALLLQPRQILLLLQVRLVESLARAGSLLAAVAALARLILARESAEALADL